MSDAPPALAALAVQYWKLCAAFERELAFAAPERVPAAQAQLRFAQRKLDTILESEGLRVLTYDGGAWSAELPPTPINAEDVADSRTAQVDATIEPTIVGAAGVLHPGKILLRQG
ncbi:hypothetical protein AB2M62_05075 [Sphingomonas sp. MMS12-HWE2-04]|uniref:hypothetical protein n=1 Tax=Sphingomonas sp. MMS12-HWE2-04 TaxID=3234199 RepID=UPI00385162E1